MFHQRSYESLFCFLSDRAYLVLKSPPQFFVRCWHVWGHISSRLLLLVLIEWFFWQVLRFLPPPCLTREWARMGGIPHGAWQTFRFQSLSETKLIKNCRLASWFKKNASWFRKRVSWYMTWNTRELKLNSTILTHSKRKLMLILSILIVNWWIWIKSCVTFGVA